ncbi:MAG TPA: phosphoribosylamine--glycine ligase [Micromonosporaceae bacterium]
MRVLLIGSGGREHALSVALASDPTVDHLVAAPGNPGIATAATEVRDVATTDPDAVAGLAVAVRADLVVVGPEAPLVAGVADAVRHAGIACFGPSRAAARIEGSKAFAKDVMAAAKVPTARSRTCHSRADVERALDEFGGPYVVKHDGLAAGKGVVVTADRDAALAHAAAASDLVVEEYLSGPEVSLFVITDGSHAVPLLPAQDFKRIGDGDTGPNTGGMGAYTPLPWAPPGLVEDVMSDVVRPTLGEMASRGATFTGLLYCGLVLTGDGPKVIEFNCRFGDPEVQSVLALLETPLGALLYAAATDGLAEQSPLAWRAGAAVTVVVASEGYPGQPRTGDVITGALTSDGGPVPGILHAGTRQAQDGTLVTAGGRVLSCTAVGADLAAARSNAYALVDRVSWAGARYRTDIAEAAVAGRIPGLP